MYDEPLQAAVPQLVVAGAFWQAPAPSQVPRGPQGRLGLAAQPPCGSAAPAVIGWHDPAWPETLHALQVPQLGEEQHTPSTQFPLPHSVPAAQIWPRRLRPQAPALHTFPGEQSEVVLQTATHAVPVAALQANGTHDWVEAGLQVPAPSQVRAEVAVTALAGHEAPAHCVPAA